MTILPSAYCGNLVFLGLFMNGYFMSKFNIGDKVNLIEAPSVPLHIQFIDEKAKAVTCAYVKDKAVHTVTLNIECLTKYVESNKKS